MKLFPFAASKARNRSINTAGAKIIMKLDVKNAHWLSERVRESCAHDLATDRFVDYGARLKLSLMAFMFAVFGNNFEDLVAKKQKLLGKFQEIINAASYAPLPPSEGLMKRFPNYRANHFLLQFPFFTTLQYL
ncbi:Peptidyl-tRNA hydrolase ict1, mitochondrial [Datura stramonium]|uniref:Peptidyl-tRNA hydrolase ict1, mitochondrial n=1 Tax=Datura stramonium TaxID=4076 RepID=A0ABS8WQV1_DATST|nr:Peptidyl-tRNA hydrolase ict1, mitochondrial [Datura stramonium]